MIHIIGKLICKIRGRHKRGIPTTGEYGRDSFACPTCGRVTSYKRKDSVIPLKKVG